MLFANEPSLRTADERFENALQVMHEGRYDEFVDLLQKIVEQYPDHVPSLGHLAWHYVYTRQYRLAKDLYDRVLEIMPNNREAQELHERLRVFLDRLSTIAAAMDFPKKHGALIAARSEEILTWGTEPAQLDDNRFEGIERRYYCELVIASLEQGFVRHARRILFGSVFRDGPAALGERWLVSALSLMTGGLSLFNARACRYAAKVLCRYYRKFGVSSRPPWGLIWLVAGARKSARALVEIGRNLRKLTTDAYPFRDIECAIYQRATHVDPQNEAAREGLALVYASAADWTCCERYAASLADANPESSWNWLALGYARSKLEKWKEAMEAYQGGLIHDPNEPKMLLGLGLVASQLQMAEEAERHLSQVHGGLENELYALFVQRTQSGQPPQSVEEGARLMPELCAELGSKKEDLLERPEDKRGRVALDHPVKTHPCPNCGGNNIRPVRRNPSSRRQVAHCETCGLYHVNPQSTALQMMKSYKTDYLGGCYGRLVEWRKESEGTEDSIYGPYRPLFRWLEEDPRIDFSAIIKGEALDVGCASGAFLTIMSRRGWRVTGVEPSTELAELARAGGHDVRHGVLETQGFCDNRFDLVSLLHVIEHVPRPLELLNEIARVTRPGGHLILATPLAETLTNLAVGGAYFDQPDHLFFFSLTLLCSCLEACGFEVIAYRTIRDAARDHWQLRSWQIPEHPLLVHRMEVWNLAEFVEVFARRRFTGISNRYKAPGARL